VQNQTRGRIEDGLAHDSVRRFFSNAKSSRQTFFDNTLKRLPVRRILRDGLAEVPRLACPVVDCQRQMMGGDGAGDCGSAFLYSFDGCCRRRVFQYDAQTREGCVDLEEVGNEIVLCVEDVDILMPQ
jgi:hypothetical protein